MMNAPRILFAVAMIFAVCAAIPAAAQDASGAVTISNLRYGLVCGADDVRRICFQTGDVQVTDESRCVFNGQPIACTWTGYEFDYSVTGASKVALQCTFDEDVPVRFGNPKEELQSGSTHQTYTVELDASRHHFFNPQYSTAVPGGPDSTVTQSCSWAGNNLFTVTIHEHEPDAVPVH